MRNPMRAALRLALTGWLGLAGLSLVAAQGRAAPPPEKVVPDSAVFFVKVNNAAAFREAFRQSQFGQLWNDPAMKPLRDDLANKLQDANKDLKEKVGVTLHELLELPEGPIAVAVLARDDADHPVALAVTAEAGKNADRMASVMGKANALAGEQSGVKHTKEEFKGQTIHVIQGPKPDKKDGDDKDGDKTPPPLVWTRTGTVFTFGTEVDTVKDLVANASGRENALSASDTFAQATRKLGSGGQVVWYVDAGKLLGTVVKAGAKGKNAANMEQFKAVAQVAGLNSLKAIAGTYTLNAGTFDSVSKMFIYLPQPAQGLFRLFPMPKTNLKPEPWVPASVASYQTYSWDLDKAFVALNDLANMFQPGVLNVLEQQLVGPNGGEPINFKKDVFDPLGNRVTLIGDFKKPIKEDSQRMLLAVKVDDAPTFQNTLNKLISIAGGAPKKREFQGATIYDFDMPELPNANAPGQVQGIKGPIGVTVFKNTLFVSSEPTLLEQVLRGGGPALADSPAFQAVAREMPTQSSSLSFVKPEESARLSYDMIKSGQFEKALAGAAAGAGPAVAKLGQIIDKDKLPEFSVFSKYLSAGGGYSVSEDDGMTFTSFTLRKSNP
jgi:hypothetical protein